MIIPDIETIGIINALSKSNVNFAFYRLPWTDACYLLLQKDGDIEELSSLSELDGRKGFVMSPFISDDNKKILLIRPDILAFDWDEISSNLRTLYKKSLPEVNRTEDKIENKSFISEIEDRAKKEYESCFEKFHN